MAIYLDFDGFKNLTTMPSSFVDDVESVWPGWVEAQLEYWARWIDARLRKRYATPFAAHGDAPPTPPSIQGWLARIVNVKVYLKRGVDPDDLQFDVVRQDATGAQAEVLEAANSEDGWFDIPTTKTADGSAINRGNPRSYSEQSPYVWTDAQQATGRNEDRNGGGTFG